MQHAQIASILAAAAELDERDTALAVELETVERLSHATARIQKRVVELQALADEAPAERAALDATEPGLRTARLQAAAELDATSLRLTDLESKRRAAPADLDQARREHATALAALVDADARLARLDARRVELRELEAAGRAEGEGLVVEAGALAGETSDVPRISEAGRGRPGEDLSAVADWCARTLAALFVVRGQLETERERVVREASELGAGVLGEPLGGSSVSVVRERIERALRA